MCCASDKALYGVDTTNDFISHFIADDGSRFVSQVGDYSWVIPYRFGTSEAEGSEQDKNVECMVTMWTR